jgi:inositol-phosphate phosphatase / L-galactose 1-phosphate phosphatase / histidinol-phosphatase
MFVVNDALIALANRLADATGAVIRPYFRGGVMIDDKQDASPVTIADREAELAARGMLAAEAPTHGVIGEEFGAERADAPFVWVIDPIDGTKAFITGRPIFGTLIALLHEGTPVLGVIDQPITGDRWVGALGHATTLSARPARVAAAANLAHARLSTTGPQYFTHTGKAGFDTLAERVRFTTYGGDCYQYGLLASGGLDLVVEEGLKLHDFAALVPVVTGAGGVITDWQGNPLTQTSGGRVLAAASPALHNAAMELLYEGQISA